MKGLALIAFYCFMYATAVAQTAHTVNPASPFDTVGWRREREFKSGSLLKQYSKLFKTLHGKSRKVYFRKTEGLQEIQYDDKSQAYYGKSDKPIRLTDNREVMGWHLHWMEAECPYYPYQFFSTIGFFAYDIDAHSGACTDADAIHHWLTSPVHDSARIHHTQVLLTLTSYGTDRTETFLNTPDAWMFLSDTVRSLIRQKKAHGIDLDFNGLQPGMKQRFTQFIQFIRNKLGDSTVITLQIPYNAVLAAYDLNSLKPLINTFVVQGFDYRNPQCNNTPLPMAPLRSDAGCPSLEKTADVLLQTLTPEAIIIGFPLYGTRWQRTATGWKSLDNMPYENIRAQYNINHKQYVETYSGSSMVRDETVRPYQVVWYEGQESLDRKFKWIKEKRFKGAGLWGLGYDGNHAELWNTVAYHFTASPWQKIAPIKYENGRSYSMVTTLHRYRKIIGISLFIIIGFFLLGLLFSLLDWRVRDAFFHSGAYRGLFAAGLTLATVLAVYLVADTEAASRIGMFTYGILAGAVLVYIASTAYLRYKNKLP
jgi:hypothetical protein